MSATMPFGEFLDALDGFTPSLQCVAEAISGGAFDGEWRLLGLDCRDRAERTLCPDPVLDYVPKRRRPSHGTKTSTSTAKGRVRFADRDDPLKNIEPRVYVEALTGEAVPANGWLSCPLPDHEDRTPSFQVLSSHWRCFGCNRGGSVIDLAAALYGIPPTGRDYWRLRDRILEALVWAPHLPKGDR